jgi:hypothetical protein
MIFQISTSLLLLRVRHDRGSTESVVDMKFVRSISSTCVSFFSYTRPDQITFGQFPFCTISGSQSILGESSGVDSNHSSPKGSKVLHFVFQSNELAIVSHIFTSLS